MHIPRERFEAMVAAALDNLPPKFSERLHNVAIFVEDYPDKSQLTKLERKNKYTLFGIFEGYAQGRRINVGAVLPDRITIFRKPICEFSNSLKEAEERIMSTIKHEIAHHFGMDEAGARKASRL